MTGVTSGCDDAYSRDPPKTVLQNSTRRKELIECSVGTCGRLTSDSESRYSPSGAVHLVANIEGDEQRGHGLDDARILQLAAINGAHAWNLGGQFGRDLPGTVVVAAHDDIAIHWLIALQHRCRKAVESTGYGDTLANDLGCLLSSRA